MLWSLWWTDQGAIIPYIMNRIQFWRQRQFHITANFARNLSHNLPHSIVWCRKTASQTNKQHSLENIIGWLYFILYMLLTLGLSFLWSVMKKSFTDQKKHLNNVNIMAQLFKYAQLTFDWQPSTWQETFPNILLGMYIVTKIYQIRYLVLSRGFLSIYNFRV